jgi:long-chain acyl-CoA synthetase
MSSINAAWQTAEKEHSDEVIGNDTIPQMFDAAATRYAESEAQWYKGGIYDRSITSDIIPPAPKGQYAALTYAEMQGLVQRLAAGFRELGIEAGSRVGILAGTRMEWAQCDLGILSAGGVVTTVYTETSPQQVQYLLDDPDANGVVVENEALLNRVLDVEEELDLEFIIVIDQFETKKDRDDIYSLAEVYQLGETAFDPEIYSTWLSERTSEDLASLIYTSGTTGRPKGVQLSHQNFRANVNQCRRRFGPRPDKEPNAPKIDESDRSLSFLPLAHVFERLAGNYLMFASGSTVGYAESAQTVSEDIQLVRPTVATSVPRVYERIFDSMREQASGSELKESIFNWSLEVAREYAAAESPGIGLRVKHTIADRLVFSTVHEQMGGNVEFWVSGGGSLSKELAELFEGMGLPILEGYGLTETSPVVSTNPPEDLRAGTLGPPLVGVETKLDPSPVTDDQRSKATGTIGELLLKGANVTEGYWNRPEATAEAFTDDGWFRTGDIIEESDDGYLIYHERLKQIIVLDTGKNVAPGPIEDGFATREPVDQVMVMGDDQKFISALIVPNFTAIERWAEANDVQLPSDKEAICQNDQVRTWMQKEVAAVNTSFEKHERIKEFRLVPEEWTPENELLTPSMKLKRRNILEYYMTAFEGIYDESDSLTASRV